MALKILLLSAGLGISLLLAACEPTPPVAKTLAATPLAEIQSEVGQGRPLVLEVGATGCSACIRMGRLLAQKQTQYPGILFRFVDLEQEPAAARALQVRLIPTQIFFDARGREQLRHLGEYDAAEFDAALERLD